MRLYNRTSLEATRISKLNSQAAATRLATEVIVARAKLSVPRRLRTTLSITPMRAPANQSIMSDLKDVRVAALYQGLEQPLIRGVRKSMKSTRYHDIGSDILFSVREKLKISIVTPIPDPDPAIQEQWCFPDTESGILSAIENGATHIWVNTVVFAAHPLQTSSKLDQYASKIQIISQPPVLVENCDDKEYLNNFIRAQIDVPMPRSWLINDKLDLEEFVRQNPLPYPIVAKPVRGRASQGVKVCRDKVSLFQHVREIFPSSPAVMVEEFLSGEEATVAVMQPSDGHDDYWALPVVARYNQVDDIAPYNAIVPVIQNSKALTWEEAKLNPTYAKVARDCEKVAKLLKVTAPIRIDVRRFEDDPKSPFALFDVNIKPNLSGPGRPGRDDRASLIGLAASGFGWDYPALLLYMLKGSCSLESLRKVVPSV